MNYDNIMMQGICGVVLGGLAAWIVSCIRHYDQPWSSLLMWPGAGSIAGIFSTELIFGRGSDWNYLIMACVGFAVGSGIGLVRWRMRT